MKVELKVQTNVLPPCFHYSRKTVLMNSCPMQRIVIKILTNLAKNKRTKLITVKIANKSIRVITNRAKPEVN